MRAVVAGGGVAGSASAIALARIGADVTVYEAYEDPAGPVGSYVSLAVNGLRALDALGCLPQVQRAGFPVAHQRMWSGRGKLLGDVARGRRPEDSLCSVTLMRADLVTVLRAAAMEAGARIITGQRLDVASDSRVVDVDLIVGADGIWSATRRAIDPTAPEPAYAGLYTVSGTSGSAPAGLPSDGFNWVFGRHGVFIFLPVPDGTVWWSAQVCAPEPPPDPAAIGVADLTALFGAEAQATAVLRAATAVRTANPGHVLKPVTRRHGGRTVLIGDAAHPVGAGQGASIAMEDAVILARHLTLAETDATPDALAAFDRERHPRAGKLAKMETRNRDAKTAGPIGTRMREVIMPHVFSRFYEKATGWLYDFDPGTLTGHVGDDGAGRHGAAARV
ncbi:MAG TPA: FAD-dependent monooxygenase [Streptosporangiaceae bacterium]|nr:FAD-dependent monooxygenase [Streptosporangiaceae bacterium]